MQVATVKRSEIVLSEHQYHRAERIGGGFFWFSPRGDHTLRGGDFHTATVLLQTRDIVVD
jgi:hypothetical protein